MLYGLDSLVASLDVSDMTSEGVASSLPRLALWVTALSLVWRSSVVNCCIAVSNEDILSGNTVHKSVIFSLTSASSLWSWLLGVRLLPLMMFSRRLSIHCFDWASIGASGDVSVLVARGGVPSLLPGSSVWTTADTRVCCESPRIFAKETGNASK